MSTKDCSRRPCRREVCRGPVKAFSVLAVSSCLLAGIHPLAPGPLLPCLPLVLPLLYFPSALLLFWLIFTTSSSSPSLTSLYTLSGVWASRDFKWSLEALLEVALLLCLPPCPFHIFLCQNLNPADQQHCYNAAEQEFSLVIRKLAEIETKS